MTRKLFVAVVAPLVCSLIGCKEDLGSCPEDEGRVLVASGGTTMYLGQALLLNSCATGCHSSVAKGAGRVGAPAGLDFDIGPVQATGTTTVEDDEGNDITIATADDVQLAGLRARQRKVFDQRYEIWDQVQEGLMPPTGVGAGFRSKSPGDRIRFVDGACTRGEAYPAFSAKDMREALRGWLACGAPVIEVNSDAVRPEGAPGQVGDQYPSCAQEIDSDPTLENVTTSVFVPSCVAGACHGDAKVAGLDLRTPEAAYASLIGAGGATITPMFCPGEGPLVTPGDPEASFLYEKVASATQTCGGRMPPTGTALDQAQIDLLGAWIEAGAPGPGEAASGM